MQSCVKATAVPGDGYVLFGLCNTLVFKGILNCVGRV